MAEGFLKKILEGKISKVPAEHCCVVDVRDVAEMHYRAVVVEDAKNNRFIAANGSPSF